MNQASIEERVKVHFFYSVGSRYSYLASTRIANLEYETGCEVLWRPLYSVDLYTLRGSNPFESGNSSGQYDWSYRERDASRWAEYYGVPYKEPRGSVSFDPRYLARTCVAADSLGAGAAYSRKMFEAIFVEALPEIGESECLKRAGNVGLPGERFKNVLDSSQVDLELETTAREAREAGAFGVPTFVVGGEMFWGNDRLVLLKKFLQNRGYQRM